MASAFISVLAMIGELGIGASIIQAERIDEESIQNIFGVILVTFFVGFLICLMAAPWISAFFKEPKLVPIIRAMGTMFILLSFLAIPEALIIREMNFKVKAKIDIASQMVGSATTLVLAILKYEVWALVFGFIAVYFIKAVAYNIHFKKIIKPSFRHIHIKSYIKYGIVVTLSRVTYGLFTEVDKIIAGRFLGGVNLGIYAVAANLSSIPAEKILPIVSQVTFTSYSRIQKDKARINRNILRTIRAISYLGFPLFFGMIVVAPFGIPLLLGNKWETLVVPFQLFCIVMPFRALSPVLPPAIFAVGKPNVNLSNMVLNLIVMSVAIYAGIRFGLNGICMAWVIVFPFLFFINSYRCLKILEIRFAEYLHEMIFPFFTSVLMVVFVVSMVKLFGVNNPIYSMVIMCSAGSMFYLTIVYFFKKDDILKLRDSLGAS